MKNLKYNPNRWLLASGRFILAIAFIGAGLNHFRSTELYVSIMPNYLPAHQLLVYISGVFEVLGGVGILIPSVRTAAAIGLVVLTLAVFPANIHMAMNAELFTHLGPKWVWYARLPLQFLILAWVYCTCLSRQNSQ